MNLTAPFRTPAAASFVLAITSSLVFASPADAGGPLADAQGDALDIFQGGGPLTDMKAVDIRHDGNSVHFEVSFFTPITPPSEEQPNGLGGVVDFDVDQDAGTGIPATQNQWSPPFASIAVGAEFALMLGSEYFNPGFIMLVNTEATVAWVPVTYTTHGISGEFPLSLIDDENGMFNFSVAIGNATGPTDAVDAVGTSYVDTCASDLNGDGSTDGADLGLLLGNWGSAGTGDLNNDGTVDGADLGLLLGSWGPC